jgi:hypothetical protein
VRGLDISSTSSASFSVIRLLRPERGFSFEASAGFDSAWDLDNLHSPKGDHRGAAETGEASIVQKCFPAAQPAGRGHQLKDLELRSSTLAGTRSRASCGCQTTCAAHFDPLLAEKFGNR